MVVLIFSVFLSLSVVFTDKTQTNTTMESICYLDKYVLTDGAKIKIENQTW
jgi:hypothetical protein